MKFAIIGAGVSGLLAAYRLQHDHEITVFEQNDYLGGHSNTVDVEVDHQRVSIDTGFIVFNDWTYPNFIRLLAELEVASQPTTMSFSVRDNSSGLEYNGHSLDSIFAQRKNLLRPRFYRMLFDIMRFNRIAPTLLTGCDEALTVEEFLKTERFSRQFVEHYLLPMGAAIWSCPTGTFGQFPVKFIAEFYQNHGLLNIRHRPTWRVVAGGSRTYVQAIQRRFTGRIMLNAAVKRIQRFADRIELTTTNDQTEDFEQVIFACHSDQALKILGNVATAKERELLSAFPYSKNSAVLHTDHSLLPQNRRAWASWNYLLDHDRTRSPCVTYNMNLLQGIQAGKTFCVTLNGDERVNPHSVLRKFEYHHPVFTTRREMAQKRYPSLLNLNRTWYCGAYWGNGFHEDGVNSALRVVQEIQKLPISIPQPKIETTRFSS